MDFEESTLRSKDVCVVVKSNYIHNFDDDQGRFGGITEILKYGTSWLCALMVS